MKHQIQAASLTSCLSRNRISPTLPPPSCQYNRDQKASVPHPREFPIEAKHHKLPHVDHGQVPQQPLHGAPPQPRTLPPPFWNFLYCPEVSHHSIGPGGQQVLPLGGDLLEQPLLSIKRKASVTVFQDFPKPAPMMIIASLHETPWLDRFTSRLGILPI